MVWMYAAGQLGKIVQVIQMVWYLVCLVAFWAFFFNDTATTEIYTLSLHDALPI